MRRRELNLASRPFSNQAPVLRVAVVLGLLAAVLLVLNVSWYYGYFSGAGQEARQRLSEVDSRIATLDRELSELRAELAGIDLETMNQQVVFLNARIAERTFGWSRLFEDLGEVLPDGVRLQRLAPRAGAAGNVELTVQGAGRGEEGLLELIDALFAHERFVDPSPGRESARDGQTSFTLTVTYLPPDEGGAADEVSDDNPADEGAAEEEPAGSETAP